MGRVKNPVSVNMEQSSLPEGSQVDFVVENLDLRARTMVSFSLDKVERDYTEFRLSSAGELSAQEDSARVACPATCELEPGLYLLSQLTFSVPSPDDPPEGELLITHNEFGLCLFEIRSPTDPARTQDELFVDYQSILSAREREFRQGFGGRPGGPGMKEYLGLVFVKSCYLTRQMRLGQYEVLPIGGLACRDEFDLIQRFLNSAGLGLLTNIATMQDTLEHARRGQPVVVVRFPRVVEESPQAAGKLIENEVELLVDLLSLHRNSNASVFGSVLQDLSTQQIYFRILTPTYRGNLVGGFIAGEDPRLIKNRMANVRVNGKLQLYLALYREAIQEERLEFQYFRFWNLLETIARSMNYAGQPLYDWKGYFITNRRGNPRMIQDRAENLVTELLRCTFLARGLGERSLAGGLQQGLVTQMVSIWYRHRNCVVHRGGCFPNDPTYCDRQSDKYVNCKAAHDEIVATEGTRDRFTDRYLWALREAVTLILDTECR